MPKEYLVNAHPSNSTNLECCPTQRREIQSFSHTASFMDGRAEFSFCDFLVHPPSKICSANRLATPSKSTCYLPFTMPPSVSAPKHPHRPLFRRGSLCARAHSRRPLTRRSAPHVGRHRALDHPPGVRQVVVLEPGADRRLVEPVADPARPQAARELGLGHVEEHLRSKCRRRSARPGSWSSSQLPSTTTNRVAASMIRAPARAISIERSKTGTATSPRVRPLRRHSTAEERRASGAPGDARGRFVATEKLQETDGKPTPPAEPRSRFRAERHRVGLNARTLDNRLNRRRDI